MGGLGACPAKAPSRHAGRRSLRFQGTRGNAERMKGPSARGTGNENRHQLLRHEAWERIRGNIDATCRTRSIRATPTAPDAR